MQETLQELWIKDSADALAREIVAGNETGARRAIMAMVGHSAETPEVLSAEAALLVRLPDVLGCDRDRAEREVAALKEAAIAAIARRRRLAG